MFRRTLEHSQAFKRWVFRAERDLIAMAQAYELDPILILRQII